MKAAVSRGAGHADVVHIHGDDLGFEADIYRARLSSNALKSMLSDRSSQEESRSNSDFSSRAGSLSPARPILPDVALSSDEKPVQTSPSVPSATRATAPGASSNAPAEAPVNVVANERPSSEVPAAADADNPGKRQTQHKAQGVGEGDRSRGGMDLTTIQSLKGTIESLLRDLNKAITERDAAKTENERLSAAVAAAQADDSHAAFLRQEIKSLRENKARLEEALQESVQTHQDELKELRERFIKEMEHSENDKTSAIRDIEESYSEALRAAQTRTSDARTQGRAASDKVDELTRENEALRTQLRQVEADRSFQASVLEDERRQFNKFREDALRKQSTLEEQAQDKDQRLADLEAKLRSVTLELSADKQERVRAYEKLRGEMETVVHSRDNARTNASTLRRELDNAVDDARQWRMAADKLEARVRELEECNKEADKTVEAMRDKVALVEQMRTQELQDLEHIGRALHAQQRQRDDFRLHAADRLAKAARSPATAAAIAPHHQDEQVLPQLARERVAPQLQRAEPPLAVPTGYDVERCSSHVDVSGTPPSRNNALLPASLPALTYQQDPISLSALAVSARTDASPDPNLRPPSSALSEHPLPRSSLPADSGATQEHALAARGSADAGGGYGSGGQQCHAADAAVLEEVVIALNPSALSRAAPQSLAADLPPHSSDEDDDLVQDILPDAPVRALADIYVVAARGLPRHLHGCALRVRIRLGKHFVITRAGDWGPHDQKSQGAAAHTSRGGASPTAALAGGDSVTWRSNFRCTSSDPDTEMLVFDVYAQQPGAAGEVGEELEVDGVEVGRVAVPLSRVLNTGKEAGWYEVRNPQDGATMMGAPDLPVRLQIGCAAALVSADIQRKPLKAGWIFCRQLEAPRGEQKGMVLQWQRRHAILDPYTQVLSLSNDRRLVPLPVCEGSPWSLSVRMGRVECNAKEPRHAVIVSEDERMALDICALSSNSMSDWLDCLESAGALISDAYIKAPGSVSDPLAVASQAAQTQQHKQHNHQTADGEGEILGGRGANVVQQQVEREVVLTIKGVRDLPPDLEGATSLRNPFVLIRLRSGRFRTKVVDLSLHPVFNQYLIFSPSNDPVVLLEVYHDDKSGEGMYGGVGTLLLASLMLTKEVLGAAVPGASDAGRTRDQTVWLPLSPASDAPPTSDKVPHVLVSVETFDGEEALLLKSGGAPLIPVSESRAAEETGLDDSNLSADAEDGDMGEARDADLRSLVMGSVAPDRDSDSSGRQQHALMAEVVRPARPAERSPDEWSKKTALVKAQMEEAEEWFDDADILELMQNARSKRISGGMRTGDADADPSGGRPDEDRSGNQGRNDPDLAGPVGATQGGEKEQEQEQDSESESESGLVMLGLLQGTWPTGEVRNSTWEKRAERGANRRGDVSSMVVLQCGAVAVGRRDGRIEIYSSWLTRAGEETREASAAEHTLQGHQGMVLTMIGMGSDCKLLLSACVQGMIRLWDVDSGACVATTKGHSGAIGAMVLIPQQGGVPDGRAMVATGGEDWNVTVWQVRVCKTDNNNNNNNNYNEAREDNPEASRAFVSLTTLKRHSNSVLCLCTCPPYTLSGSHDTTICVWSPKEEWKCLLDLEEHESPVLSLATLPDADRATSGPCKSFASLSADATIVIWETGSWTALQTVHKAHPASSVRMRELIILDSTLFSVDSCGLIQWNLRHADSHSWERGGSLRVHISGTRDGIMNVALVPESLALPGEEGSRSSLCGGVLVANRSGSIVLCALASGHSRKDARPRTGGAVAPRKGGMNVGEIITL